MIRVLPEGFKVQYDHGRYEGRDVQRVLEHYEFNLQHMTRREALQCLRAEAMGIQIHTAYEDFDPSPKGGITIARVIDADDNEVARGAAHCSLFDNYSRPLGRTIALGRALKALENDQKDVAA